MLTNSKKNTVIFAITAIVIVFATVLSLKPELYFFYEPEDRAQWRHPTGAFLLFVAFFIAEAALLAWALRIDPGRRIWRRALAATLLLTPWALLCAALVVHAPYFMILHIVWVWLLLLTLAIATVVSAIRNLTARSRSAA